MKQITLVITIALLLTTSCALNHTEDDSKLTEYDHGKSIIENMPYLFQKAEKVMGGDARLILICGNQKIGSASKEMNLDLYCYFTEGGSVLEFDITNSTVTLLDRPLPLGHELLSKDEVKTIYSVEDIWDLCIKNHDKGILNFQIYRPLVYPALSSLNMYLFTKDGINFSQDFFCYDMNTGTELLF